MLGIELWEVVVILIVIVVCVKPEDMPRFFRMLGQWYAEIQHYIRRARSFTNDTLQEWSQLDRDEASRPPRAPLAPPPETPPASVLTSAAEVPSAPPRPPVPEGPAPVPRQAPRPEPPPPAPPG